MTPPGIARSARIFNSACIPLLYRLTPVRQQNARRQHQGAGGLQVEDAAGNRTSFVYDPDTGRPIETMDALSNSVYTAYDVQGRVTNTWGGTYPVAYRYDDFGRMSAMLTWRDASGSPDTTLWQYDEATGLLTNKVYADDNGTAYSYTSDGDLATRTWARGITTTYSYTNTTGEMLGIDYGDSTPDISFAYDRVGRQVRVQDAQGTRTFAYDPATLALTNETIVADGVTNSLARAYDSLGRSAGVALGADYAVDYAFDAYGRFGSVSSSVQSVSSVVDYSYLADSDMVAGYDSGNLAVRRAYEPHRDLIASVSNLWSSTAVSTFAYDNDAIGRRTKRIDLAATNTFGYNTRNELTSALMGTAPYSYAYDADRQPHCVEQRDRRADVPGQRAQPVHQHRRRRDPRAHPRCRRQHAHIRRLDLRVERRKPPDSGIQRHDGRDGGV